MQVIQWASFLLCDGSQELSPLFCSKMGCCGSESTEYLPARLASSIAGRVVQQLWMKVHPLRSATGGARSKAWDSCWVVVDFLIVSGFFLFPGVSVTSSNTGVPDISGSVYNKTQVSNAGPSSLMA